MGVSLRRTGGSVIEFMRCNSLLEFAVGFVSHLYCAAFWAQSRAVRWHLAGIEVDHEGVHGIVPRARLIRG